MDSRRVVATLEQLYSHHDGSIRGWARHVVDAAVPLLDESAGVSLVVFDAPSRRFLALELRGVGDAVASFIESSPDTLTPETFARFYRPPRPVVLQSELGPLTHAPSRAIFEMLGVVDMLGLCSEPEPGVGLLLSAGRRQRSSLRLKDRAHLTRIALHCETALRARLRPDRVCGTLTPEGRFELGGAALDRNARSVVHDHMQQRERARLRRNRHDGLAALDVWQALVLGKLSLVERIDSDGKRLYDLCENAPRYQSLRALVDREASVVTQAARGLMNKEISYALGMSAFEVSQSLSSAAYKLGVSSTRALVRLVHRLHNETGSVSSLDNLTEGERAVAALAATGMSNIEIARARQTSERTVANQISSILRKTGLKTRRGLSMISLDG